MDLHWFLWNYDIDQQSVRSRLCEISTVKAVCRAFIEALDLLWCRRGVDKRIPQVVDFRRGLLGNVSWRKATDVQRLLIMPISIWSIPVFKFISQPRSEFERYKHWSFWGSRGPDRVLWCASLTPRPTPESWLSSRRLMRRRCGQLPGKPESGVNRWSFLDFWYERLWQIPSLSFWFNVHFVCQFWGWKQVANSSNMYCSNAGNTVQLSLWRILNFLRCGFKRSLPLPQRPASVSPWCPWTRWKRCFRWEELQV